MIFNSVTFLVFFILFYIIYWLANNFFEIKIRNGLIILASYLFYGWWDWRFLSLIIISSFTDFFIGYQLNKSACKRNRKLLLAISLFVNLGLLGFFKYCNFFVDSLQYFLSSIDVIVNIKTLYIILPVGISFYTFQTLSYTIDIYKKKLKPTTDILSFFAFVSFFPQLVAGPIERASNLLKQFHEEKKIEYNLIISGLRLTLWGFFKKIVLADNFGALSETIFSSDLVSGLTVFIGILFFAIQIYADFSGYSDIAIGISKMLGFELMTNFKTPYFATSFRDFWKRWHISLSSWFRDYVYIPLGGNRNAKWRTYYNLFITFLLSGLWHGANVTFVIWGGLHGLFLIFEKQFKTGKNQIIYYPFVLLVVILLWLPFRAKDYEQFRQFVTLLLNLHYYTITEISKIITDFSNIRFMSLLGCLVCFLYMEFKMQKTDFNVWIMNKPKAFRFFVYYFLTFSICFLGKFSIKPGFIYFQF